MKNVLFLMEVVMLSVVLVGCAGLGNIQQRSSYYDREIVKVCDDSGCRNQLVEVQKDIVTDAPSMGYSNINVGLRVGRRGFLQMGSSNYSNGYGGYNGYPVYNGYPGYNAYRMPGMYPGRPMPGCIGAICW